MEANKLALVTFTTLLEDCKSVPWKPPEKFSWFMPWLRVVEYLHIMSNKKYIIFRTTATVHYD